MKILVIGASGVLAGPVIRSLDEARFELRLFSRIVKPSMFINEYDIVQGDLYNPADLKKAVRGCDAIHITISNTNEVKATEAILKMAREENIKLISMVSGCTVSEENRWFSFIDKKFRAEQLIMQSGIPYYIFRPTWFFESLEMLVRNGKATILGRQTELYHWVAADDFGRMVANAYRLEGTENGIYYVYGPERYRMKELLEKYCREFHPEIKKVSEMPISVLKIIASLTRNRQLKFATSLFSYFEKVREPEIPRQELGKLGKAEIDFETWIEY
ncbi:MAG: NAD(P)H-binding protein [Bacteroidota bacterium]|nr:NAD(P)H-binding protein [Bacteroidota bacterium]